MEKFASTFYSLILDCTILLIWLYSNSIKKTNSKFKWRIPFITLSITFLISVPSILQFYFPPILFALRRDSAQIITGQWWRIITSLFVQDGGIAGTLFNIIILLIVGSFAEQYWKRQDWILIFLSGAIAGELAGLFWQPIGAGNSVGNFSLAGSLLLIGFLRGQLNLKILSFIGFALAILLISVKDIHGIALLTGALIAFLLQRRIRNQI